MAAPTRSAADTQERLTDGSYGKGAQKAVKGAMHKRKRGTLKSGRSGRRVKSRKQAIAIGLAEARRKGAKVPARKGSRSRRSSRRRARR